MGLINFKERRPIHNEFFDPFLGSKILKSAAKYVRRNVKFSNVSEHLIFLKTYNLLLDIADDLEGEYNDAFHSEYYYPLLEDPKRRINK